MASRGSVSKDMARAYYEDFSLGVGLRDWLLPNPRHQQLKLFIDELLAQSAPLRILDVGCGAGLMTGHLTRYGSVTGIDFSSAAIEVARRLVPEVDFQVRDAADLPDGPFDLITMFDVLEHIPEADRPGALAALATRLAEGGRLFVSTPHPDSTALRRARDDETLQVIDEEVRLETVVGETAQAGLQLLWYRAFDVFAGSPEYQAMVFASGHSPGGPPRLRTPDLARLSNPRMKRIVRRLWRVRNAARVLRQGKPRTAWWFLTASAPRIDS